MKNHKNILVVTAFVPGKLGAAVNFTRQLLEDLANNHCIDVMTFNFKGCEKYEPINPNINILKSFNNSRFIRLLNAFSLPFLFPLFTVRFNWSRLIYFLKRLKTKKYDLIIFDHSQVFVYSMFVTKIPCICMVHDVMTQRISRSSNLIFANFCKLSEKVLLKKETQTLFSFSEKDKILIKELFDRDSHVTTFYLEEQVLEAMPTKVENYFVFFAFWGRSDNYYGLNWFLENVYPFLRKEMKFKIIGKGLNKQITDKIALLSNIEYLGFVENPYPIIANSLALISPLFTGAGVKVKVIESLACGTKIIGNKISFEGISNNFSNFFMIADDANSYIRYISTLDTILTEKIEFKKLFIQTYLDNKLVNFIQNV